MNLVAIGRSKILHNAIQRLHEEGYNIQLVVTSEPADYYEVTPEQFESLAREVGAAYEFTSRLGNIKEEIERLDADLSVSTNWKFPIEGDIMDLFKHGILNAHAGDLPRYRGNASPNWAILNGESTVTLTVHRMTEEIDAGPIFCQHTVPVTENTYLKDIYSEMCETFPDLFVKTVAGIEKGTLEPEPQSDEPSQVLRGLPRIEKDSEIDWTRSATHIDRIVRASAEPLFGAFTYLGTKKLTVWRAHRESPAYEYCGKPGQVAEVRPDSGEVAVVTGEDFLVIETAELEGGQRAKASEVINSIRIRLGMDKQAEIRRLKEQISILEEKVDEV